MVHSATHNALRIPRIITNPNIQMKQPFNFDRGDASEYSLIEIKTLKELATDRLAGWKVKGKRQALQPARVQEEAEKEEEEKRRLEEYRQAFVGR